MKRVVTLLVRVVIVVVVLVLLALMIGVARGRSLMMTRRKVEAVPLLVSADSVTARGRHLATVMCASCHSPDQQLPLTGGTEDFLKIPNGPTFGSLYAPNLTPGGKIAEYTDDELACAIREGVDRSGYPLLIMPSHGFHVLSDRDVAAIVATLRAQAPVKKPDPETRVNPLGYLILGFNLFPLSNTEPIRKPVPDVPIGPTFEYGEYLVSALDCRTCHGADLRGGKKGQFPPIGPDLGELCATHSFPQFDQAFRRGTSMIDGHTLDPTQMPWTTFARLDSVEALAIYERLRRAR